MNDRELDILKDLFLKLYGISFELLDLTDDLLLIYMSPHSRKQLRKISKELHDRANSLTWQIAQIGRAVGDILEDNGIDTNKIGGK